MSEGDKGAEAVEQLPEWALIVREPYASYIVSGIKTWEIRRYRPRHRGRIGIVSKEGLLGTVELVTVHGPFTVEELLHKEHWERHRADETFLRKYARGEPLYVWELRAPHRFPKPIPIVRPRGPVVWLHRPRRRSSRESRGSDRRMP